ncbi:ATP-dependent RNA helicase DbpA [Candidatus Methanoplasma termitum]|uniref:DbpA1 protein n=1 Tax=Candidatus Methanoplasma termitum TaxID=1577791 RepID=A0A0A7LEB6_9ARCH|nr:helicase-related protein [Candidatus Methanoplasma termitum]AIZ56617.1 ATP-dependent RNA helicase DbpA [Candidatus Methanoplasma termitum]MCL2334096.1 DEAD/DEAH box helicase family protein [Candidatus Methanoplasma sp.]
MGYISHPKIVPDKVEERKYQMTLAKDCLNTDTLVVLPTGLGKTIIALYTTAVVLSESKKVLLMAPTKPLVDQHTSVFSELLVDTKIGIMNGLMKAETRQKIVESNELIVSTPQCIANDLENGMYDMDDFGLVIYDEAHRGTGNYAYVTVAAHCTEKSISMGLTASPGSDIKKVEEVCRNLRFVRIEIRTEEDPDVAPYIHDTYVKKIEVNLPKELLDIIDVWKALLDYYFKELKDLRLVKENWPPSRTHMLMIGESVQKRLRRGERSITLYRGLTVQSICMKILHAIELAETQGMSPLRLYMAKLNEDALAPKGNKGGKELVARKEYLEVWNMASESKIEHPKVSKLMSLVSQILNSDTSSKVMVFTQYRDTCDVLIEKLSGIEVAKVGKLIGQSNGGLRQKEQIGILDEFRTGAKNVIVATSVGEEGLDVASTNAVIFYEPVPSEIRTIQRRGRTGRKNDGEVFVLIAKGTMDEVFENSSKKKEDQMRSRLDKLNKELSYLRKEGQWKLGDF